MNSNIVKCITFIDPTFACCIEFKKIGRITTSFWTVATDRLYKMDMASDYATNSIASCRNQRH